MDYWNYIPKISPLSKRHIFYIVEYSRFAYSKESSGHVYPRTLTAYITGLLLTVYIVRIKKLLSFMLSYSHNVLKYIST